MRKRSSRLRCGWLVATALMVLGVVGFGAAPAWARVTHELKGSFTYQAPGGRTMEPVGIAVDSGSGASAGDVYVASAPELGEESNVIYKFEADGTYAGVTINGAKTPARSFSVTTGFFAPLGGIAVDSSESAGDVYVADVAHNVVDKFGQSGEYICQITGEGIKSPSECVDGGAEGEGSAPSFTPKGITVAPNGDLYVANEGGNAIDKFSPTGSFEGAITGSSISEPTMVGVAEEGNLFVRNGGGVFFSGPVVEVDATGAPVATLSASEPRGLAADPTTGHAYVTEGEEFASPRVGEYAASGGLIDRFGAEQLENVVTALGLNTANGSIYAAQLTGTVDIYSADLVIPTVQTQAATEVKNTSAVLHGKVEPAGGANVSSCKFEYGTTTKYGSSVPCQPGAATAPYAAPTAVSAPLSGLSESTTYYYRVVAENEEVSIPSAGEAESLRTTGPPAISEESTSEIERYAMTLKAKINPDGSNTVYHFEYGPCPSEGSCASAPYPASTPSGNIDAGTGDVAVSSAISGLTVGTAYHFRAVATNEAKTVEGAEATATTIPVAGLEFVTEAAGPHAAEVKAEINPYGLDTTCRFEYVAEAVYDASQYAHAETVPCAPALIPGASGASGAMARISGLAINAAYRYRFVVENESGKITGLERTLATFGLAEFSFGMFGSEGGTYTRAGGHPYEMTTTIMLDGTPLEGGGKTLPSGNAKDIRVQLPPGLIGNPNATERCSQHASEHKECSGAAQVGTITIDAAAFPRPLQAPLFDVVPAKGVAAEFSARFNALASAFIYANLRTGEGYGIGADSLQITKEEAINYAQITMWGVPGDHVHDAERGCPTISGAEYTYEEPCNEADGERPFLTAPTSCTGAGLTTTVLADSYQAPGEYVTKTSTMPAMTGCEKVPFSPSIAVIPRSHSSDSPTGLHVDLTVPQNENPNGLAEADLKDAEVKLPVGMTVNPASARGLVGCQLLTGKEGHPGASGIDLENGEGANCPNASKIGSVHVKTPLLDEEVIGGIYVAQQNANPFKSLLALYIAAEAPERGVVIKLAGHVELNPVTGQLTTTFDENPQLPFSELKLDFFGGQRAPLATPRTCGTYTATSLLEPWSHQPAPGEAAGTPNATPESPFTITSGPGGSACDPAPFGPAFEGGTASNQAGSFSPFVMNLTRKDGEQRLSTVDMTMPKGVAGMLSTVPLCSQAQAEADACPAASQVGHVLVKAGVGSEPVTLPEPGRPEDPVYLLGKTEGAPFGLAIVVHPEAGPFNLQEGGKPVIVLAKITVNPRTAQVSVASKAMPSILRGIPVDVQALHVVIDRKGFMFNPTSCTPMSVTGTIGSQEGASAAVSSRFQAAGCRGLPFKPKFSALIHAHHTKKNGEYLHVVIGSAFGQANLREVHVTLPAKLPSRDSTLKLACSEAQFAKDPAGCPAGSFVGHAVVHTPVLAKPLVGPAIFVSHGGREFPNLDLVLQGEGVTIINEGDTFISKKGITTSSFNAIPDVPVRRISLVLPAGPHSALAGEGNLCKGTLHMPATLTGQNGAVISQKTKVMVEGCKAEIYVGKTHVHDAKATILVHVPSAGKLIANGKGIHRAVKRVTKKGGRAGITVHLTRGMRRRLHRHHRHHITVRVHLKFKPRHGKTLAAHVNVKLR